MTALRNDQVMNGTSSARKIAVRFLLVFLSAPIAIYAALLAKDAAVICWKIGWDSRPFVFVSVEAIVVYLIYAVFVVNFVTSLSKTDNDKYLRVCGFVAGSAIALYWLGFLTVSFGVLK